MISIYYRNFETLNCCLTKFHFFLRPCIPTDIPDKVGAEHLALEAIDDVGPGGNFIASDHTFAHLRTEYFNGNGVTDRKIRDDWEQDGSQDAAARAREIVRTILAQEEKSYIPVDVALAIRKKYNITERDF